MKEIEIGSKTYLEPELEDVLGATDLGTDHVIDDWPWGSRKTCKMHFSVESTNRGERLVKQSTFNGRVNKPKKTTYASRVKIIEIDGKIGHVELTKSMSHVGVRMQDGSYKEATFWDEDAKKIASHFFSD
jgi:hypothetical protein